MTCKTLSFFAFTFFTATSVFAAASVSHFTYRRNSSPAVTCEAQTLPDYMVMAYNTDQLKVEKFTTPDDVCGSAYFVSIKVRNILKFMQVESEFYVQTLNEESQTRLYEAILKNYSSKGLPKCLLADHFIKLDCGITVYSYNYDPDLTTVSVTTEFKPVPPGSQCFGQIERPITSCWNVKDPYGD